MGSQTFTLTMEDYTIILNTLHYYKQVGKRGRFLEYDNERINNLRDKLAYQLIPSKDSRTPPKTYYTVEYEHIPYGHTESRIERATYFQPNQQRSNDEND